MNDEYHKILRMIDLSIIYCNDEGKIIYILQIITFTKYVIIVPNFSAIITVSILKCLIYKY